MISKLFEIRDRHTLIVVLATRLEPNDAAEHYLFARSGYGEYPSDQAEYVLVTQIDGGHGIATSDPFKWDYSARSMRVAHHHILQQFDQLETGAVIDVEFILGETERPKVAQRLDEASSIYTGETHGI